MTELYKSEKRRVRNVFHVLLLSSLAMGIVQAAGWQIGTVDGGFGGRFSSLRLDTYGNAHVVSFSPSQNQLRYSFWDHNLKKWFTADLGYSSGFCSIVLDSKQRPHVSYPNGTGQVKWAYFDGDSWQVRTAPIQARIISYYTSITLDSQDNPSISFYEEAGAGDYQRRLRIVTWNGKFWAVQTVDGDQGSGKFNSMATDSAGYPEIAYGNVDYKNASLRYARWNGKSWAIEVLEGEGEPGTNMWSVSMVLDKSDVPHIAYTDLRKRVVKYATKMNGKWQFEVVDSLANVSYADRNGIALDGKGNPYISYYDGGLALLKVAHQKDHKWVTEVVDQGSVGVTSSLQIYQGTMWVTYSDASGDSLMFARRAIEQADSSGQEGPLTTGK
jgi:hypothetical protein